MAKKNFETEAIRGQTERSHNREHSVPIYATSSYMFDDAEHAAALFSEEQEGNVYSRYSNPNNDEFAQKLCALEGAEMGMAMSSGMAAVFVSIAAFVKSGDHVVACRSLFGSTHQILTNLLPRWGITHTYVDILDKDGWEKSIQSNTKMIVLETPSNPALDIMDLSFICDLAKSKGILVNVDNCFATPYLQNPIKWGVDIVTHSATKYIDGQGRVLGGAILTSKELFPEVKFMARHTGPAMSPFHGWVLSKSLETLSIRMEKHCENAMTVAKHFEDHQKLEQVRYPFLASFAQADLAKKQMRHGGGIVTLEVSGGIESGRKFLNGLKMLSLSANLGDTRSIATHPASTTHSKLSEGERLSVGITPGLVRVSVGLEHIDDIIEDIEQSLNQV